MGFAKYISVCGIVLILATIFSANVAGEYHLQRMNRTCIPAEAEPVLNSSSCYPLVNFTRPFCQKHGITLPNYVYTEPYRQTWRNQYATDYYNTFVKLGESKNARFFNVDVAAVRRCTQALVPIMCHVYFPKCDRTGSVYKRQTVCRQVCLDFLRICDDKVVKVLETLFNIDDNNVSCEPQPFRNAGDSPECWYADLTNSTDTSSVPEWITIADCLYLNGSSYHGNISVTASGIPCQSWTEQCPHRHTMNTAYPELNNTKNFCRNPKNSGQRPWCFTTDRNKRWEYCDIPNCTPVQGNYGNWSLSSTCNVTCGQGFETWTRDCNNPEPKFGGRSCSHLGESVEYRPCLVKLCPINGGYSNWSLSIPCNVSCGEGVEMWRRCCDNPEPKYEGSDCSALGNSTEFRKCKRRPCPIDGNYSNWSMCSPCSVTCGQGVEVWTRECDNPPGKYGGNCSKQGAGQEVRFCEKEPCPVVLDSGAIGLIVAVVFVFVVVVAVAIFLFFRRNERRQNRDSHQYYPLLNFPPERLHGPEERQGSNISEEDASSSQEAGTRATYQNLTAEGNPVPGLSRGVVPYRRDYMNTRPSRSPSYDRLQLFRMLAVEWLRNAWGNVDEFDRHVYDGMQRNVGQDFFLYDKLGNIAQDDSNGSGTGTNSPTYNTLERPSAAILPTGSENASTSEIA